MFCTKCGADVSSDASFCPKCGYHFSVNSGSSTPPSDASTPESKMDAKSFTDVKPDEVFENVKSGGLIKRVIGILFSPSKEWEIIAAEKPRIPMMIFGYSLILGVIAFVCLFIGTMIDVFRNPFVSIDVLFSVYFAKITIFSTLKLLILIGTPIIAALIINSLCQAFKTEKNFGKVFQLTTFSFTPVLIAWTMYVIPFGFVYYLVQMVGLYGIILLLLGFKKVLIIPDNKQVGFFFTMAGILFGVYYMLYWTIQFIQAPFFNMGYNYLPY